LPGIERAHAADSDRLYGSARCKVCQQIADAEVQRRARVVEASPGDRPFVRMLVSAADQFIVKRGE